LQAAFFVEACLLPDALTLLVGDAAAGLASGLARGLALATAAGLGAVAEIPGLQGLDALHGNQSSYLEM